MYILDQSPFLCTALAVRARPHLSKFWGHARVELGPPGLSQWPEIKQGLGKVWQTTITGKMSRLIMAVL